jgi:hypothetical protein
MDLTEAEELAYVKEEEEAEAECLDSSSKPVRRRARLALSCQRYGLLYTYVCNFYNTIH